MAMAMISIKNNTIFNIALLAVLFCFAKPVAASVVQDTLKHNNGVSKRKIPVEDIYYQPQTCKEAAVEIEDSLLQAGAKPIVQDTSFRPNHFSIDIIAAFYPAPELFTNTGSRLNLFNPSVFISPGVAYSRFWRKGFGLKVGGRWGLIPVAPKQVPLYNQTYFYSYLQFSACAAYRISFKKNFNLYFSAGIASDVMLPIDIFAATSNNNIDVYLYGEGKAVFFDVPFEITASKVFMGKDELNFGLSFLMPFSAVGYGQYFANYSYSPAGPGTFTVRNEYIGIKLGYTFLGRALFKKLSKKVSVGNI